MGGGAEEEQGKTLTAWILVMELLCRAHCSFGGKGGTATAYLKQWKVKGKAVVRQ